MTQQTDSTNGLRGAPIIAGAVFAGILVAANAAGAKIIQIGPLAASATALAYALSFPITDYVAEIYGRRTANKIVVAGFIAVVLAVIFYQFALYAPGAPFFEAQDDFESVFSLTPRILAGGLAAYLVSQFLDVWLFHKIRAATKGRFLWLRNLGSTLVSQFIDTVIFITIAFYGVFDALLPIIIGQYIIKIMIAFLDTPFVYLFVWLKKKNDQ